MEFSDFIAVLLRRWRLILVGALLTLATCGGAIYVVPTDHQATGQMILLLPPRASGTTPINPYLNLDPGLTIAASLVAATVSSETTLDEMEAAGFTSTYSVALNPGTGPLLEISAEDTNAARAVATRNEVMRRLDTELDRIQIEEDVPSRQFIHARRNNVSDLAQAVPSSKIRALAVIGGAGAVTTLIIAFLKDRGVGRTTKRTRTGSNSLGKNRKKGREPQQWDEWETTDSSVPTQHPDDPEAQPVGTTSQHAR